MAKHLVTGGAGFIGSHICEELIKKGHSVVCLDNFVTGTQKNLDSWWTDKATLVRADISKDPIDQFFDNVDVVFHNAASKCTVCRDDPQKDLLVNAWGSWRVFEASRKAGVRKVVHASTGSVYGDTLSRLAPKSFYGVSKLAGEQYLGAFHEYYPDFSYAAIRYFHVYGSRQDSSDKGGVIPIFIRKVFKGEPIIIYGDGNQVRHFTYVKDVVSANLLMAEDNGRMSVIDCASMVKTTINELAELIMSMMHKRVSVLHQPERGGDIRRFAPDSQRLFDLGLDWTDFEDGLEKTIWWYVNEWT